MKSLSLSRIDEPQIRDNFRAVEDELKNNPIISGQWRLFDREFLSAATFTIYHKLGFKPLDLITTYSTATFTADLSGASEEVIEITVTVPGRVRFLLGRMK
jgi:HSP20 family molecular chaperone IbpA